MSFYFFLICEDVFLKCVGYITSCEMPPYTLFVSTELFILVFLIYESYMLNT